MRCGNPCPTMNGTFSDEACCRGDDCRFALSIRCARSPFEPMGSKNHPMKRIASAACLSAVLSIALAGCGHRGDFGNDAALYRTGNDATPLSPGTQPVRIGESGPAFAACTATGQVVNLSPAGMPYLPLRAAPFDEAGEVARLGEGTRVFLCARSLDQRWQGVILPPADTPGADCGVTAPIEGPRDYAGPCRAGWALGTFLKPGAP